MKRSQTKQTSNPPDLHAAYKLGSQRPLKTQSKTQDAPSQMVFGEQPDCWRKAC